MTWNRRICGLLVALFLIITSTTSASAQSSNDLLSQMAKMYAAEQRVSLDEALQRLNLQDPAGALNAELTTKEVGTFAGLWIQHTPQFRIVVQFTRNGTETLRPYVENGPLASVVEVRAAPVSLADLSAAQAETSRIVDALGVPADSSINVPLNRVEVYVTDLAPLTGVVFPPSVTVVKVNQLSKPTTDIYAGLPLSNGCTTGFAVRNSSGTRGILTAGHCDNTASYNGVNLPYQPGERYFGSYDVQWHTAPGLNVTNQAAYGSGGTGRVTINNWKNRTEQAIGDYVCHYGRTTGFGCGYIQSTNIKPSWVPNSNATFVLVRSNTGADLSAKGDSGGPWYAQTTLYTYAYGTMSGEAGTDLKDAVYMPINYAFDLGVSLIIN